ncbi:MAG: TIGR02147 family protein [Fibrobacteres bacterium]|nr:TIGR02147 family protein [Fibrobacterota bacterium]
MSRRLASHGNKSKNVPSSLDASAVGGRTLIRPQIHDYLDYRRYLRDAIAFEKAQGRIGGHRDVAMFVGLKSPGHITWILQGKRNLVGNALERMLKLVQLTGHDAEYFKLLVGHNDTANPDERRLFMARISASQALHKVKPSTSAVRYWSHWRHSVVRELVAVGEYGRSDTAAIARRLQPIATEAEVADSLDLLLELGMIDATSDGMLVRSETILSTGENWTQEAIRGFQNQILELSIRALNSIPREEREISTVTFSVSRERFQKIRTRIQEMRSEILALVRTDPEPQEVYHLAVELFPATSKAKP